MLQRSCNLLKSVSPQTVPKTDTLGYTIMGLLNGCSRGQLHTVIRILIRSGCTVGSHRYNSFHRVHIYPKKEFISSSLFSRAKSSKPTNESSNKKDTENDKCSPEQQRQDILSKEHTTCDEKLFAEGNTNIKSYEKSGGTESTYKPEKTFSAEEISLDSSQTLDKHVTDCKENSDPPMYVDDTVHWLKHHPDHISQHDIKGTEVYTKSDSKTNEDVLSNKIISSQVEAAKVANEIKVQKGKSPSILLEKARSLLRKSNPDIQSQSTDSGSTKIMMGLPSQQRKRPLVDLNKCSTERNFITPVRAMTDFLLKPSDLEGLRKTKRRSPYENDPPITVYWRKDVEAKAIEVWGSKENLLKEILKRDIERRRYQQNIFTVKRRLRDYRREQGRETEFSAEQNGLLGSTGRVVLTAIFINGGNFLCKLGAWWYTGSHSMFSEALHSLADTVNQLILAYGIYKSVQRADSDHPYGYTNMRYVSSLISGVAIFCLGSGLSFYHGVVGLTDPNPVESYYWAFLVLTGSFTTEGATLLIALNSVRKGAKTAEMKVSEYILRGNDPSVNVILLEDAAAVLGVLLAGGSMGLSAVYNSHIPDAIGSLLVGGLLAGVATFIIYTNVAALVGRSIPQERLDKINAELESDVMIRAIHDVKGIDIGNSLVRYKAEMDFDGGELTRSYLDKQDLNQMLEEVKKFKTIDELEEFMLKHGENIVDMMGGEIDRIELKLRKKHPEIRHCDLEIL